MKTLQESVLIPDECSEVIKEIAKIRSFFREFNSLLGSKCPICNVPLYDYKDKIYKLRNTKFSICSSCHKRYKGKLKSLAVTLML